LGENDAPCPRYRSRVTASGGAEQLRPRADDAAPVVREIRDITAYQQSLADAGVDVTALVPDSSGTVCAAKPVSTTGEIDALPLLGVELSFRGSLGDGGMGVVRLAEQRALLREVAVKSARTSEGTRGESVGALVREGRIAGGLEHPNIVPVHALGRSADGEVLLVMKRIEGSVWSAQLAQRKTPHDDLRRHVEVLIDVCRAVQFAHARGVLHRDLKPSNVMVGSFGEVYVLDWGISVPVNEKTKSIWGTPAYMAPEMTMPGEILDERADVYLLGGLLHVVLASRPPHVARSTPETLHLAHVAAPPAFAPDVPHELAAICARALSRDRADRYATAALFREALEAFIEHASARSLAERAAEQLRLLTSLVDADSAAVDGEGAVYRAYSASRFGFEQALREWPEFQGAQDGLRSTLIGLARFELRAKRPDRARALTVELAVKDRALDDEIAALERALAAEAAEHVRLENVGRAFVLGQQSKRFALMIAFLVVPWLAYAFVVGARTRNGAPPVSAFQMMLSNIPAMLGFAAVAMWLQKNPKDSLVARFSWLTSASIAAIIVSWSAVAVTGGSLALGLVVTHAVLALLTVFCASVLRPAMYLCGAPILLTVPVLLLVPAWALEVNAVALASSAVLVFWLWPSQGALR
jgi:serine/threonine-protein kinase